MKVLAIGNSLNLDELKQKFGASHTYTLALSAVEAKEKISDIDIVFDFIAFKPEKYLHAEFKIPVFINTAFATLRDLIEKKIERHDFIFGFCGLPTFLTRPVFEVATTSNENKENLKLICSQLNTDYVPVQDRIGMVTPKVICMIINEAYRTLEEGTATRDDIDLAMKLGTNYPFGPFEWASRIGISHVINLLDAAYRDTGDQRYYVCALLRAESANQIK